MALKAASTLHHCLPHVESSVTFDRAVDDRKQIWRSGLEPGFSVCDR